MLNMSTLRYCSDTGVRRIGPDPSIAAIAQVCLYLAYFGRREFPFPTSPIAFVLEMRFLDLPEERTSCDAGFD